MPAMADPYLTSPDEQGVEEYDLRHSASELSKRAPDLFLPEGAVSEVHFRKYTPAEGDESANSESAVLVGEERHGTLSRPKFLSNEDQLLSYMKVCIREEQFGAITEVHST